MTYTDGGKENTSRKEKRDRIKTEISRKIP